MALWGPKRKRVESLASTITKMVMDAMPLDAIHRKLTTERKLPAMHRVSFWRYAKDIRDRANGSAQTDSEPQPLRPAADTSGGQQHGTKTKPKGAVRPSAAKMKKFVRYKILTDEDTD